jgi:nucleoside-diphosphate-sugar epimerase
MIFPDCNMGVGEHDVRVLVLGGTGLTGPFVVRRLCGLGHRVTVFHRGEHEADRPDDAVHIRGSLADPPLELGRLTAGVVPDVVVDMWAMNQAHAAAFLERFQSRAARAVVISSCDVYRAYGRLLRLETGPPDAIPLTEDSPLRESRYPYRARAAAPVDNKDAYDKILVEETLRAQTYLPVTILRYPAVYGPNDMHRFGQWVRQITSGAAEIHMQEDFAAWRWTHGFAEDVAEAVVLAVTHEDAANRTYNVGEAATPTWAERVASLGQGIGWHGRIVPVAAAELPEAQRMPHDFAHHLVVDSGRIRRELGYRELVAYEEGLRRTVEWERG